MRMICLLSLGIVGLTAPLLAAGPQELLDGLIFHAPFDDGSDARLAAGD